MYVSARNQQDLATLLVPQASGRPFHPIKTTMSTRKSPSAPPVCLGRLLGAGCDGSLEKGETLFQKYLCTSCKGPAGFFVELQYVRCVPSADAKSCLPEKGGTLGGFRWSKPSIGHFQFCLCNERYERTRKATNVTELVYEDAIEPFGLVLLRPGCGAPEPEWAVPSPQSHPSYQFDANATRLRLSFWKDEKMVAVRPRSGRFSSAVAAPSGAASSSGATSAGAASSGAASSSADTVPADGTDLVLAQDNDVDMVDTWLEQM